MQCKTKPTTPAQQLVIEYLDGLAEHFNRLEYSEYAHHNFPPRFRKLYDKAKKICNGAFLVNARVTLRECFVEFVARLWENAETFAARSPDKRQAYAIELMRKSANKAIRRPKEKQLPEHTSDRDISVPSCTRNPLELDPELQNHGKRVYQPKPDGLNHLRQGYVDWVLANEYENALIEKIERVVPNTETEYERCVRLLGEDDADWYWTIKANHELFNQRRPERMVLSATERKRFQRLNQRMSQLDATSGTQETALYPIGKGLVVGGESSSEMICQTPSPNAFPTEERILSASIENLTLGYFRASNTRLFCVEHGTVQAIIAVESVTKQDERTLHRVVLACGCRRDSLYKKVPSGGFQPRKRATVEPIEEAA